MLESDLSSDVESIPTEQTSNKSNTGRSSHTHPKRSKKEEKRGKEKEKKESNTRTPTCTRKNVVSFITMYILSFQKNYYFFLFQIIENNAVEDTMNGVKITFTLGKGKTIMMGGTNPWNGALEIKLTTETQTKPYNYFLNSSDIDPLIRSLQLINSVNMGKVKKNIRYNIYIYTMIF